MGSFYGGPAGRSFEIKHIFSSYVGTSEQNSMLSDLSLLWSSPIAVGDYVMISYGVPGTSAFNTNRNRDVAVGITLKRYDPILDEIVEIAVDEYTVYNGTLWQKIYNDAEADGPYAGLSYALLSYLVGSTPLFADPITEWEDPATEADVEIDTSVTDTPVLTFHLPRGVVFHFDDITGFNASQISQSITNAQLTTWGYGVGDYYIHNLSGYIFAITAKNGNTYTFTRKGTVQVPAPTVTIHNENTYKAQGGKWVTNDPTIQQTYNQATGTWVLNFGIPAVPTFAETPAVTTIGVDEPAAANVSRQDANTVAFSFSIPRGSRIFSGTSTPNNAGLMTVEGAKKGDIYLNNDTGKVYQLGNNNIWTLMDGNLKGPAGPGLNIIDSYDFTEAEVADTIAAISAKIEEARTAAGQTSVPASDELIEVNWKNNSDKISSYWFYYITGDSVHQPGWNRATLTSGVDIDKNALSISYTLSIEPNDWENVNGVIQYSYENTALRCGSSGNVPPIVTDIGYNIDYHLITEATATPEEGIVFIAERQPTTRIDLVIIDLG